MGLILVTAALGVAHHARLWLGRAPGDPPNAWKTDLAGIAWWVGLACSATGYWISEERPGAPVASVLLLLGPVLVITGLALGYASRKSGRRVER